MEAAGGSVPVGVGQSGKGVQQAASPTVPRRAKSPGGTPGSSSEKKPRRRRHSGGVVVEDHRSLMARIHAEAADEEAYDDEEEGGSASSVSSRSPGGGYYSRSPGGSLYGRSPPHRCVQLRERPSLAGVEDAELQLALALSLSSLDAPLSGGADPASGSPHSLSAQQRPGLPPRPPPRAAASAPWRGRAGDDVQLSYEALSELEDVRPVAPLAAVDALPVIPFHEEAHADVGSCTICQQCYCEGDILLQLPCGHYLHNQPCAREWLLKWSKRCPECKRSAAGDDSD